MHSKSEHIVKLAAKWDSGTISEAEQLELDSWYREHQDEPVMVPGSIAISEQEHQTRIWNAIQRQVQVKKVRLWAHIVKAAAIVAIVFGVALSYYNLHINNGQFNQAGVKDDVAPGKMGATLTLANGKKISLNNAANGELSKEAGVVITKSANGQLTYEIKAADPGSNKINTLSTAKGETYQLRLPDGSLVWLNAASSLTYRVNLTEHGKRQVRLIGEGYFEIAKDKRHPFIVTTDKQEVKVLGTHFNISSYTDEPSVKTTLLEGSLSVNNAILKPNQQAILSHNDIKILEVDAEESIAWKDGLFKFTNDENITSIMRKLARWYNIEVEYKGNMEDVNFTGTISRFKNISSVLKKMEQTGMIKFKIEGKKVIVESN